MKGYQTIKCNSYLLNLQDIDKEIGELKMSVNTRGRLVATEFLKQFVWRPQSKARQTTNSRFGSENYWVQFQSFEMDHFMQFIQINPLILLAGDSASSARKAEAVELIYMVGSSLFAVYLYLGQANEKKHGIHNFFTYV